MVKRFLITTSLEESWIYDKPVLFLGEWCKKFSRKDQWKGMDFEMLPYHWDDRIKLFDDYKYLQDLQEHLLRDLTKQLNDIHGVNHSIHYWRILIGIWLGIFTQILFDRWTCIQDAVSKYDISSSVIFVGNENVLIPNDTADFNSRLIPNNDWDHHIYSTILQQCTKVQCEEKREYSLESIRSDTIPSNSWKNKIKRSLLFTYMQVAKFMSRDQDAFFLSTYMSMFDEIKMQLRLGQFPQIRRTKPSVKVDIDLVQRQWSVRGNTNSDFEVFLRNIIPKQIPVIYLEGYKNLINQIKGLNWPKNPKIIFTSNSHYSDDVFKAWAAERVEKGSPLVIGQHGGHYGIGLWSFTEDHEIAISTSYLSWGWSESSQEKVKPVGQLKPNLGVVNKNLEKKGMLMVTTTLPVKSYRMYSVVVSRQWLDYFDDNCVFVKNLPESIRGATTIRLHSQDREWDQVERWRERFPMLNLDKSRSSIAKKMLKSRIVVNTYNATAVLESISMNIPTVIFWNPKHWEIRGSAKPYFEDLKRVGVFHETPESAAKFVVTIWDDVESWWASREVRDAVNRFKEEYCTVPDDILDRVEVALQDAILPSEKLNINDSVD